MNRPTAKNATYDRAIQIYGAYLNRDMEADGTRYLEAALSGTAKNAEDHCDRGRVYYYMDDYENAESELKQAIDGDNTEALVLLGVDYGIDYYAMQTLLAPDGRRIMIAWMQNWDTLAYRCNDSGWFAQMSLPRELSVKNGRLYQVPIRELNAMRANKVEYNNVVIKDTRLTLDQIEGRTVDLELVIRPADKDNLYKNLNSVLQRMRNIILHYASVRMNLF